MSASLISANSMAQSTPLEFSRVQVNDEQSLFYAHSGNESKLGVLFIHGTPGSWTAFERYLQNPALQRDFFLVSVDRLGWGKSALSDDKAKVNGDFASQSAAIGAIFNNYPDKKWVLVGHSLGASIAPQVALDHQQSVSGALLLAGSLKPSLGKPRWYNHSANTLFVSSFLSRGMKNSNREIMALKKQLSIMDEKLKQQQLNTDLIIMQGTRDKLVSPKNPAYAHKEWKGSFRSIEVVELDKAGHFLPWKQTALVNQLIYKLADLADQ